jgi:hypothetical protein
LTLLDILNLIPYKININHLVWAIPLKRGDKIADQNKIAVIPDNRGLAKIFHDIGFIEGWGTGFQRMVEGCAMKK